MTEFESLRKLESERKREEMEVFVERKVKKNYGECEVMRKMKRMK